jgi:hypothetical protein
MSALPRASDCPRAIGYPIANERRSRRKCCPTGFGCPVAMGVPGGLTATNRCRRTTTSALPVCALYESHGRRRRARKDGAIGESGCDSPDRPINGARRQRRRKICLGAGMKRVHPEACPAIAIVPGRRRDLLAKPCASWLTASGTHGVSPPHRHPMLHLGAGPRTT